MKNDFTFFEAILFFTALIYASYIFTKSFHELMKVVNL